MRYHFTRCFLTDACEKDTFSSTFYHAGSTANEKLATVKRMLALGKSLQDIMLITDLPINKIQELQAV